MAKMSQSFDKENSPPPRARQKPGAACEECRRRKLRCDRRQPQCGMCEAAGVDCLVITARSPRGPKRGYLKMLQARVAALEGILLQQQGQNTTPVTGGQPLDTQMLDDQLDFSAWEIPTLDDDPIQDTYAKLRTGTSSGASLIDSRSTAASISLPDRLDSFAEEPGFQDVNTNTSPRAASEALCEFQISEFLQADLDQLYFDRIQSFLPIQHQSRYFSWRRQPIKTSAQSCLQHAIWTLAASVSAHYQSIGDSLYQYTRRSLEALDSGNASLASTDLEQVQAWLLLAIYEFTGVDFRRGWISAGRAFRLIQLNWLHGTDGPDLTRTQTDWIDAEQKRRTFWMAYCLDRFVSMRTGSPLTFSERVAIRLPSPEANFQNDQPILMGFLPEALTATDPTAVSTFTECIVVATIAGRALSHRHQCLVGDVYFNATEDFWNRHQWIHSILMQRMDAFSSKYPCDAGQADPMLLFINLMWRTIILHLYQTMACVVLPGDDKRDLLMEYKKGASAAAQDIVDLTNKLCNLSSLKVHPLTLIPLSLCVEFLVLCHKPGDTFTKQLQDITEAMRGLKRFNNLGQGILQLVEEQVLARTFQPSAVH